MADIIAANVTAVKLFDFLPPVREPGLPRRIIGIRVTIATNTDYDTTTEIPLDNLFDSTKTSYLGLKAASCVTFGTPQLVSSTNHWPVYLDWTNKKMRVLKIAANTASADVALLEMTDGVACGTGTCDIMLCGEDASL